MAEPSAHLRMPPHSMEAEQNVLGALLMDNVVAEVLAPLLRADDFYAADHRAIFVAAMGLIGAGKPADLVTVWDVLGSAGNAPGVELAYLNELTMAVVSARNVAAHAAIVRQCSQRRRLVVLGSDLVSAAFIGGASDADLPGVIDRAAQELADMALGKHEGVPTLIGDLIPLWIDDLIRLSEGVSDAMPLGLHGVDRALAGGARPGDLIVVGARPSMGKSALTLGVVRAVAAKWPVLVCSLEDSANMFITRQMASTGRIPLEHLRMPQHAPDSIWSAVTDASEEIKTLPVWLDDRAGLDLAQVVAKAKFVKRKAGGLGLVVVDYLQLMEDEGETRSNELARIARGLKNMAKRLGCAVLLLSQLSREADKVTGPPRLDHLAESGAIEQAADIIGLLWRECRRNPKPGNEQQAQLEFVKNKNGATATVKLWFDGRTQRFEDASAHDDRSQRGD